MVLNGRFQLVFWLVLGCDPMPFESEHPTSNPTQAIKEVPATIPSEVAPTAWKVQLHVASNQDVHGYEVRLQWPSNRERIRLQRAEKESSFMDLATLASGESEFVDSSVREGFSYRYRFMDVNSGSALWGSDRVEVPIDLEIKGVVSLESFESRHWKLGRLVFRRGGRLDLYSSSVVIQVNQLISDQGEVRGYPSESAAALRTGGAPSGNLLLIGNSGRGILNVNLIGQRGGAGIVVDHGNGPDDGKFPQRVGAAISQWGPGWADGSPGGPGGNMVVEIADPSQIQIVFEVRGADGGPRGGAKPPRGTTGVHHQGKPGDQGPTGQWCLNGNSSIQHGCAVLKAQMGF